MAVTMVSLENKVRMAEQFFIDKRTLTEIGGVYNCSRKTVRRCVDEIKEIVDGFEEGQEYIYQPSGEVFKLNLIDPNDFENPVRLDLVNIDFYDWPDLWDFIMEYTLVVEQPSIEPEENADYFVVAPQDSITIIRIDKETGETTTRNINKHSGEFQTIREMIVKSQDKATLQQAFILMDTKAVLEAFSVGRVKVDPEEETVVFVKVGGTERRVPEDIAGDIIETVQTYGRDKGEHLVRFLDKLMDNPSFSAIEGLYRFMKHNCIEINADGSIQAWKGVRTDLYSSRAGSLKTTDTITVNATGHVYNGDFGKEIRVDRSEVDDNPDQTCSHGLHVGNREYASGWAPTLIRVSVQPQDVVAVPKDYNGAKMRTCAYTPLEVVDK